MKLHNATHLDGAELSERLGRYTVPWDTDDLEVFVRPSRGADFSGTCRYDRDRIYVNVGRRVKYPYRMGTNLARARSSARHWWKPTYVIELADAYQLALFVFLHELYHWLIHRAGRNIRQKESMCDRFAARALVDDWSARVSDGRKRPVPRTAWDFQDLDRFVAAARAERLSAVSAKRKVSQPDK
jgi:hypothetical protein